MKTQNIYFTVVLICAFFISLRYESMAQAANVPVLERLVSVTASNENVVEVLHNIERNSGCSFSYNSKLISNSEVTTINVSNKTVREVLDKIFKGKIDYRAKGNHIILTKAPLEKKTISGYVENEKGQKVAGASVYDTGTLASATTDEYGYYKMKIRRQYPSQLAVSKITYADTIVKLQPPTNTLETIVISNEKDTTFDRVMNDLKAAVDTVASKLNAASQKTVEFFTWNENTRNITDTMHREFQFSIIPYVGTNGLLCGNVENDWSFNVFGGYSKGVRKAEFAGFFNVDRGDVRFAQFAGFTNIVGGNLHGVQGAGFLNVNAKSTHGVQLAGFMNLNGGKTDGVQAAGFLNLNAGDFDGVQLSGFANLNAGAFHGAQIAGFLNTSVGDLDGIQISGFMNVARKVQGSQLGIFNFADSVSGVSIGLFSFVRKGYHKLELAYDETNYGYLSFRTGVRKFYNIIGVGADMRFQSDTVDWTFGYGIGTAPQLSKKLALNLDLTANQMVHGNVDKYLNEVVRLYAGVDFQVFKKVSMTAGVTLNNYFTEDHSRLISAIEDQHSIYSHDFNSQYKVDSWLGWRVGLRFF